MDNTNNTTDSSQSVNPINQQSPTQVEQDQKVAPVAPSSPVGLAQKEQSPIVSKESGSIQLSKTEIKLAKEVEETGVERVSDELILTDEHKAVGIEHAGESTLPPSQPSGIKTDEVKKGLQISPAYSARWLAELGRKVLKGLGLWKEK